MSLRETESISYPSLVERSHSIQQFKRQYCIQRKTTLWSRVLNSDHSSLKVLFSLSLFLLLILIGGFVTKWCEYNVYDKVVEEDIAFREEIYVALNGSDLFDELDERYTSWIVENPWTHWNSFFFWLTLMTTIGYGNIFPITTAGRLWTAIFGIFSIFSCALVIRILGNSHKEICKHKSKTFEKYPKTCLIILVVSSSVVFAGVFYYYEQDLGVGPRGQEGWTYSQSIYFVIMTFTTVGFGDFVPIAGITVILIIYGIIMLTMLVGEAQTMVKRIETDMRKIIDLAEQGYMEAANIVIKPQSTDPLIVPKDGLEIELQESTGVGVTVNF